MTPRILVIDDDEALLEVCEILLREEGYEVVLSPIVFEEVTDVEQLHPNLIVLDVQVSKKDDGLLLWEKLQRYPPTSALPIIVCTALSGKMIEERVERLQQQSIPIIYKPFEVEELLQTIRRVLSTCM